MGTRVSVVADRFKGRRVASTLLVLVTLTLGILLGTVISHHGVKGKEIQSSDATPLQLPAAQASTSAFGKIAREIEPTVVNINTESIIKPVRNPHRRGAIPGGGNGQDQFQDFFDKFFGGQDGGAAGGDGLGGSPDNRERSLGSGVIVDPKGYIVTNAHVVEHADRIRVQLADEPPNVLHSATVIGTDLETDLAVIKIDVGHALPAAKLGNSDSMQVGDWVLAVGSPFGLDQTVTAGIVSSKGRSIDNRRQFQSFIQTDAAINPGNSGGPLVDMNGDVIGINTAIVTQSAGYQGVGFALPSKTVAEVYNQLIGNSHRVARGSIGVEFNALTLPALARVYGVKGGGVTVANVTPGGPADKAGLRTGDTIVSIEGKPIKTGDELVTDISHRKPGSRVNVGYVRNAKSADTSVTVADRAELFKNRLGNEEAAPDEEKPVDSKLGITVRNITPEIAQRMELPDRKGVIVQDVKPGSFAEDTGVSRGDIILEINRQPITSEDDFRRIQSQLKSGQDVAFLVRQRGRQGTIFLADTLP